MFNLFTSLALLAAAPLALGQAFTAPVVYPHAGSPWFAGQTHNVTWDASTIPTNGTYVGQLQLTKGGDLSTTPAPLTPVNFTVTAGRVQIIVPHVQTGTDYGILFTVIPTSGGESVSSLSEEFTITNNSPTTSSFVAGTVAASTGAASSLPPGGTASGSGASTSGSASTTGSATSATGATMTIVSGSNTIVVVGGSTETGASGTSIVGGSTVTPSVTVTSSAGASTATSPSGSGSTVSTTGSGSESGSHSSSGTSTATSSSGSTTTTTSGALSVKPLGGQTWFVAAAFAVLGSALVL